MKIKVKTGVIILAAGASNRLGYPKQLVKFKEKPLLQHVIDVADSVGFDKNILVLGAQAEEIQKGIELRDFEIIINENWEEGVGSSLSKGISEALNRENKLDHVLILLSDQPLVTKEKIQELLQVHQGSNTPATFAEYEGATGVPAIFSRLLFSDLKKLKGDQGAKKLLFNNNLQFETVKFENGNFDVDTAEDVELLKQMEEE